MKKTFLTTLKSLLKSLPKQEREDLLAFYEERFASGRQAGLTEQEVLDTLESPEAIAQNVLEDYGHTMPSSSVNVVSLIVLNLFFTSWFLPMMVGVSFGLLFSGLYSVVEAGVSLLSVSSVGFVFWSLAQGGVSLILIMVGFVAFEGLMRFVTWWVALHFQAFKTPVPSSVSRWLNNLTPHTWINRKPMFSRLQRLALGGGFGLLLVGSAGTFVLRADLIEESLIDVTFSETVLDPLSLRLTVDDGRVFIERHEGSDVIIEGRFRTDQTLEYEVAEGYLEVSLASPRLRFNVTLPWVVTERPALTIKLPLSLDLESVVIVSRNGLVLIENIAAESLEVKTSNGSITLVDTHVQESILLTSSNATLTLNRVSAQTLDLQTSNGRIIVRETEALTHRYETSNGTVQLTDVNHPTTPGATLSVQSSNGSLTLNNVYVSDVRLRTSNGSIDYDNSDRSFFLDGVEAHTSNGTIRINVPRR